jgi:hypothetical protein
MTGGDDDGSCRKILAARQGDPKAAGQGGDTPDVKAFDVLDIPLLKPLPVADEHVDRHGMPFVQRSCAGLRPIVGQ